jgi:hypothetical protein
VTDETGKRELWVTQEAPQLPIRVEIFRRATGSKAYQDFVDWMRGIPISDSFFQPEGGVELERHTLEEYLLRMARDGPVGPVPILFGDLLHGKSEPVE